MPHEHDQVVAMCAAVKNDDTAGPLLTGHQPEVSVFADLYGQPCKARLDAWHEDDGTGRPLIVDLKTAQDADPPSSSCHASRRALHGCPYKSANTGTSG